jgi:aarF domain-containing kinase
MDLGVGVPRFARAMATSGMIAADYKLLGRIADWKGIKEDSQEYKDRESAVHKRTAKRILGLALSHGGIWIKLCQYVSTLKPMIPEEYTNTLGEAQDSATTRPYEAIAEVIQREFGARPEDLFAYFERSPVAAASIAQVHRAITKDGERVAVKVQYPSLPREIGADIASLRVRQKLLAFGRCLGLLVRTAE